MTQSNLFSSGIKLAPFVTSSQLLCKTWGVISSRYAAIISEVGVGLSWKVYRELGSDLTIIAFEATPDSSNLQADFVSSSEIREKNFLDFEFLCTRNNPLLSLNSTAVSLFCENHQKLDQLRSFFTKKSETGNSISITPLIVTGHALGGSVASLFTISLLDSFGIGKNRPLCITFGSPLVGDKKLQQAISRSSNWNSCFLHVVSLKDPLPRLFITNPTSASYMPFGTFLLCSDASSTCFENPDCTLEILVAFGSIHAQNQGFQSADYGNIVKNLYLKAIFKDFSTQVEDKTHPDSLAISISLQLQALGLTLHMQQQQNIDFSILETKIKTKELKGRIFFDPSRKLNQMKEYIYLLEWYKKETKDELIGYYDSYKNENSPRDIRVIEFHKKLTDYWVKMVGEAEMMPQREGAAFRIRWLYAGTNYRRMVEPLAIAQYYREGGKDYVNRARSRHYKQLEGWLVEEINTTSGSKTATRDNVESVITIDSCFWAHVEEALLSCKQLSDAQSSVFEKEEATGKLLDFEKYVYEGLMKYEVSPEIFLTKSSYMTWWNQYKAIKGTSYDSALTRFMSEADNYNVHYVRRTYNFN